MRPFYNIAHHCNTEEEVNEAIAHGANAIECDITPILFHNQLKFKIYHSWDFFKGRLFIRYTESENINNYFQNLKKWLDNKSLALIVFDCKEKKGINPSYYAEKLVSLIKKNYIDEKFCLFSVSGRKTTIKGFYKGLDKSCFNAAKAVYGNSYIKNNIMHWIQFTKNVGSSFLKLGIDSKAFFSPLFCWIPSIKQATRERDQQRENTLKKVLFWTLNTKRSMRKLLNCHVDGVITNCPKKLNHVLKSLPYCQQFRLATQNDSIHEKYNPEL